jgi:hypothetical protein
MRCLEWHFPNSDAGCRTGIPHKCWLNILSGYGSNLAVPTMARELNPSYYPDISWQCKWLSHLGGTVTPQCSSVIWRHDAILLLKWWRNKVKVLQV